MRADPRRDRGSIELRSVSHAYSGVLVLREVDLVFAEGRILGLVGQNGAGKSTVIRILTGAEPLLHGEMLLDGEAVGFDSPAEAQRRGVGVVHQDIQLFPHLSVARNIYAVRSNVPRHGPLRLVDWRRIEEEVDTTLQSLGMKVAVRSRVGTLEAGEQKLVEIVRTMMLRPRYLILDEPTASLEARASGRILDLLERLRDEGVGVMFVSHRLEEIRRVVDSITVLRDGRVVGSLPGTSSHREIVRAMIGGQVDAGRPPTRTSERAPTPALVARGLDAGGQTTVDFSLAKGEILGFTGLVGSGAERVMKVVAGALPLTGEVEVFGARVKLGSTAAAAASGIGYIPEDRKREGLIPDMNVAKNIALASLDSISSWGFVDYGKARDTADHYRKAFSIKCDGIDAPVRTLSGGNQQKVLIARWLAARVKILVVIEPTHGVDVGGKAQIHNLIRDFAAAGGSVILFSAEAEELVGMCHRLMVFRHGTIASRMTVDTGAAAAGARPPDHDLVAQLEDIIEAAHSTPRAQEVAERV